MKENPMSYDPKTARWEKFKQPCVVFDCDETGGFEVYADDVYVNLFTRHSHSDGDEICELGPHDMPYGWLCGPGLPLIARKIEPEKLSETPRVVVDIDDDNGGEFFVYFDKGVSVYTRTVAESGRSPRPCSPQSYPERLGGQLLRLSWTSDQPQQIARLDLSRPNCSFASSTLPTIQGEKMSKNHEKNHQ